MPRIKQFQVSVRSGAKLLTEYDDNNNQSLSENTQQIYLETESEDTNDEPLSDNRRQVYLEAEEGAEFQLEFEVDCSYKLKHDCLVFDVYIDGTYYGGVVCTKQKLMNGQIKWKATMEGHDYQENGTVMSRPFVFSKLTTNDDQTPKRDSELGKYQEIGQIRVEVWENTILRKSQLRDERTTKSSIPEKALKGQPIHLGVELGAAKATREPECLDTKRVRKTAEAVSIFLYRTRGALQMLEIIEPPPEPIPLEERDIDTLTREEMRKLLRQSRIKQENRAQIKREIKQEKHDLPAGRFPVLGKRLLPDDDDSVVFVSAKKVRTEMVEIVDLT